MQVYWLAAGILRCWRIMHLLQAEDGPWEIVVRIRRRAGSGFWGKLLDCFYCLSLWVAVHVALASGGSVKGREYRSIVPAHGWKWMVAIRLRPPRRRTCVKS